MGEREGRREGEEEDSSTFLCPLVLFRPSRIMVMSVYLLVRADLLYSVY